MGWKVPRVTILRVCLVIIIIVASAVVVGQIQILNTTKGQLSAARDQLGEYKEDITTTKKILAETVTTWREKYDKLVEESDAKYNAAMKLPNDRLTDFITYFIMKRQARSSTDMAKLIAETVVKYSNKYNLPSGVLIGIMDAESGYNPMAKSSAKCRGLMQINFKVWAEALKIETWRDLYEIDLNVKYGSQILKILLKQEGTLSKALVKYLGADSKKYKSKVLNVLAEFELDKHQYLNGRTSKKEK